MKTTYNNILNSQEHLQKLLTLKMPVKNAVDLARLVKAIDEEIELFNEQRQRICLQHGTINEETNQYDFAPEEKLKFLADYNALLDLEVELDCEKISLKVDEIDAFTVIRTSDFIDYITE